MKKFISVLLIIIIALSMVGCGKKTTAKDKPFPKNKTKQSENVNQEESDVTEGEQAPLTKEEKTILGKWTLDSIFDREGNSAELSDIERIPGAGVLFGMMLRESPDIEFDESRVIKMSMFNVNFSIPNPDTLILSSEILGDDITLPITYGDDTFSFLIDNLYTLTFKKA